MIQRAGCLRIPHMLKLSPIALLAVVVLGCGSDADKPAEPRETAIAIQDFKFAPEDITVDVGASVTWTNEDAAPHTATADDGSFDTGNLRDDDAKTITFRKAGSFTYFCEFHKFMRAKITVR